MPACRTSVGNSTYSDFQTLALENLISDLPSHSGFDPGDLELDLTTFFDKWLKWFGLDL